MIKKINVSTDQNNLFAFITSNYNTANFVEIKQDQDILFQGLINFKLQRSGTNYQQQTYLHLTINKFINTLKK